jgi:2-iminobutanoate/2-iminopropanoate deaminase
MDLAKIPAALYRRVGDVIYVSGHVGFDADGNPVEDFAGHAQQTFDNLKATLAAEDATLADVVSTTCFLADFANFATFNEVWAANFPTNPPSRTTVQVGFGHPGVLLEVNAIAHLNQR